MIKRTSSCAGGRKKRLDSLARTAPAVRLVVSTGLTAAEGRAEEVVDAAGLGAQQEGVEAELGAVVAEEDNLQLARAKDRPSSPRRPKRRLTRVVLGG